jgi:murein DD-endopeptidase MepM/ murein hydrolase activator NlpD
MAKKVNYYWPLPKPFVRITSPFGGRNNPITGKPQMHSGIDVAADEGANIFATAAGKVKTVFPTSAAKTDGQRAAGNFVEILHPDGKVSRYLHLQDFAVKQGQEVKAGSTIGKVGMTGATTGAHLHFEIWDGTPFSSKQIDPTTLVSGSAAAVAETFVRKNWKLISLAGLVGIVGAVAIAYQPVPMMAPRPALANSTRLRVRA